MISDITMFSWRTMCIHTLWTFTFVLVVLMGAVRSEFDECEELVYKDGLQVLNCSGKDLFELPEELHPEAEVLDMSDNQLSELPYIKEAHNCQVDTEEGRCHVANSTNHCRYKISFSRNQIDRFNDQALHSLMCLSVLDLSYNQITHDILHPQTFQEGVYHLKTLILRGNPLGVLPNNVIPSPFMVDLRELDLSHCELHDIGKDSVDDHSKLRILNLSFNELTTIHPETFKGLFSLEQLDLRQNQLSYLPARVFGDLSSLKSLFLSTNRIQAFHSDAFFSDSSLSFLDLSHNEFSEIPYQAVDRLPKLTTMDLSYNPIDTVEPGLGSSSLTTLTLDNLNSLTHLGADALASFPKLVNLSISGCRQLSYIDPHVLGARGGNALRRVTLEKNALETLEVDVFPWDRLSSFKMSRNPWVCDVRLAWMMQARKVINPSPVCQSPMKLHDRNLFGLQPRELGRYFNPSWMAGVVVFLMALPMTVVLGYLVWKRRRFFFCVRTKIRGRYVSVYTRDVDGDDDNVDIELKVNVNRLRNVSNGSADDTKPFITMGQETPVDIQEDDEEI